MRKVLSKSFDILWTFWTAIVIILFFAIFLPIVVILVLLQTKWSIRWAVRIIRKVALMVALCIGIVPLYKGKKQLSRKENYIYIANHKAYLDILLAMILANTDTKFLGKAELFDWPFIGFFAKKLAHVPVDRGSAEARKQSFYTILNTVRNGHSLFLFPEGGIFKTEALLSPFKSGAFRLAIETKKPLVVITLINAGRLNPSHNWFAIRPGKAINYISEPISTEEMTLEDVDKLKKMAQDIMLKNLKKHYPDNRYPLG